MKKLTNESDFVDIPNYEGLYQINRLGQIKSIVKNKIRKININNHGYCGISLFKEFKSKTFSVHRLIAKLFIPNPKNLPQVNHINGIKTDNRIENLEWCDAFYNQKHRFDKLGHKTHNQSLNKEQVFEILNAKRKKHMLNEMAIKFNVSRDCIKAARSGTNYKKWNIEYQKSKTE